MRTKKPLFAHRLSLLRKKKGITQVQLAEQLGVSIEMVKYYETRATHPNSSILLKISDVLGVNIDDLFHEGTKNKPGPESELEKCFDKVAMLPKRKQQRIISVVNTLAEVQ